MAKKMTKREQDQVYGRMRDIVLDRIFKRVYEALPPKDRKVWDAAFDSDSDQKKKKTLDEYIPNLDQEFEDEMVILVRQMEEYAKYAPPDKK
jgi:hypothetical protein